MVDFELSVFISELVNALKSYDFNPRKWTVYGINLASGWLGSALSSSGGTDWGDIIGNGGDVYTLIGTDIVDNWVSNRREKARKDLKGKREKQKADQLDQLTRELEFRRGTLIAEFQGEVQKGNKPNEEQYQARYNAFHAAYRQTAEGLEKTLPSTYPVGYRIASFVPNAVRIGVLADILFRDKENWDVLKNIFSSNAGLFDLPYAVPAALAFATTTALAWYTGKQACRSIFGYTDKKGNEHQGADFFTKEYWSGFGDAMKDYAGRAQQRYQNRHARRAPRQEAMQPRDDDPFNDRI